MVGRVRELLLEKFNEEGFFVIADCNLKLVWKSRDIEEPLVSDKLKRFMKEDGELNLNPVKNRYSLFMPYKNNLLIYAESRKLEFCSENISNLIFLCDMVWEDFGHFNNSVLMTANSDLMKVVIKDACRYSRSIYPVLLSGESGSGKSRIARFIHEQSGRTGNFVKENCPNIPEELFESILFGHAKGAFTGALNNRAGLIEEAEGGTLFLDEITEISMRFQSKLLTFIDEGKYRRLGETRERNADVRIVAASNRNLEKEIEKGNFRADLYYRLSVLELKIPPLRKRRQDIPELIEDNRSLMMGKCLTDSGMKYLKEYNWPGNVRELINFLIRLGVCEKSCIDEDLVKEELRKKVTISSETEEDVCSKIWEGFRNGMSFWEVIKEPYLKRELNRNQVLKCLESGLERTNGVYKKLLGIYNLPESDYKKFMNFLYTHRLSCPATDDSFPINNYN